VFVKQVIALAVTGVVFTLTPVLTASAALGDHGYAIPYPQCKSITSLPAHDSFDILGADGGRAFTPNMCLDQEYFWATSGTAATVSFYSNTGNPGPTSSNGPKGQSANSFTCPSQKNYRIGTTAYNNCSYVYDWNAAEYSLDHAGAVAGVAPTSWWLDIESANSWTRSTTANIDDIQGALDHLTQTSATSTGYVGILGFILLSGGRSAVGCFGCSG
jgi:hypothetical protein